MEVKTPHLSYNDICSILLCISSNQERIDIPKIVHRLKTSCAIDSDSHDRLLRYYSDTSKTVKETKRKFHFFIRSIAEYVPFFTFCDVLKQAGYDELSQLCLDTRLSKQGQFVSKGVLKIELPNEEELHLYYVQEKSKIDNNIYKNQARAYFYNEIAALKEELNKLNIEDVNEVQIIADKICVLYFLLSQQYASPDKVTHVLMNMREVIPHNIDRTLFDTMFHSYMAFNYASAGNPERAEPHLKIASVVSSSCANGFVRILAAQWCQYVHNILYRNSQCRDKSLYAQAMSCFEHIQQCLQDINEWDERHIWKTISVLDMVRSTVGITPRLAMCEIDNIDDDSICQAKRMMTLLEEPKEIRRKMYYLIVLARLQEKSDHNSAVKDVTRALELAPDGCYDELERDNILSYLKKLKGDRQPLPAL